MNLQSIININERREPPTLQNFNKLKSIVQFSSFFFSLSISYPYIQVNQFEQALLNTTGYDLFQINRKHINVIIQKMITLAFLLNLFSLTQTLHSRFETVAVISTNDIHGSAFPTKMLRTDTNETYEYGGLVYMASMIERLRKEYKGNVLYLDAGDEFQGGIESSTLISNGKIINEFFDQANVDGAAIGNHDLDFGSVFLKNYMSERSISSVFLAANLRSKANGANFLPNSNATKIYTLKSGIKIGVIGLMTIETVQTINGYHDKSYKDYRILDYAPIVLSLSKQLRKSGVHAVVLLSHVGNQCTSDQTSGIWKKETPQNGQCLKGDEMSKLIAELPKGTLDAVAQGHRHFFSHHFIEGIPVAGVINGGFHFNVIYLKFYNKKLYESSIQGPVPVCHKVFQNVGTCNYLNETQLKTAGPLVPMKFHGFQVVAHPNLQAKYDKQWIPLMKPYFQQLAFNQLFLLPIYDKESNLGNLVANLISSAVPQNDFVIMNPFGFRTTWFPGIIQYQHFFSMFPFDNDVLSFDMTGQELLKILRIIQINPVRCYSTKGLKQVVRIDANGTKEYVNATLANGSTIDPKATYRGVSTNFLMKGGDDFVNIMGKVYKLRNQKVQGLCRDRIKAELIKLGTIRAGSLMNPKSPNLLYIKA